MKKTTKILDLCRFRNPKGISKKGQIIWKFGSELLVAAIIVLVFFGVSYGYGSGEAVLKLRTAKDIGLAIEEMYLVPDKINTFVVYPEDTSKLDIIIKENRVTASSTSGDVTKGFYNFVSSSYHPPLEITLKEPKKLYIGKIDGDITISDKKPDLRKLSCPEIKTKLDINNILIDSGFDEDNNIEKAKLANSIAFSLISKLSKDYQVEHARNEDINDLINNPLNLIKSQLDKKTENKDTIIKIQIGEKQDNSNNIKIYFSSNSTKKEEITALACTLLNNLIENEALSEITGIAVIPKEGELILGNNKISIIIEIGNYLNENSLDMLKNINAIEAITSTIYNTIK